MPFWCWRKQTGAARLDRFVKLLDKSPANAPDTDKPQLNQLLGSGAVSSKASVNTKGSSDSEPWVIRAGSFKFRVQSKVPFDTATYGKDESPRTPPAKNSISFRPMQKNSIVSTMNITVCARDGETDLGEISGFQPQPVTSNLPSSIWGPYLPAEDPSLSGNSISTLLSGDNPTIELMTAVCLLPPIADFDSTPPKALNAAEAMKQLTYDGAQTPVSPAALQPTFQSVSSPEQAWSNAKTAWGLGDLAGLVEAWEEAFQ